MGITFKEIGDDCSLCPLNKALGCNGLTNYGNGPVYPPCSEMDEDTDVEAYLKNLRIKERHAAKKRTEKNKITAENDKKKDSSGEKTCIHKPILQMGN